MKRFSNFVFGIKDKAGAVVINTSKIGFSFISKLIYLKYKIVKNIMYIIICKMDLILKLIFIMFVILNIINANIDKEINCIILIICVLKIL